MPVHARDVRYIVVRGCDRTRTTSLTSTAATAVTDIGIARRALTRIQPLATCEANFQSCLRSASSMSCLARRGTCLQGTRGVGDSDTPALWRSFGPDALRELPQISTVLERMEGILSGSSRWLCTSGGACDQRPDSQGGRVGAYVEDGQAYICQHGFDTDLPRVMMHEAAHLAGLGSVDVYVHQAEFQSLPTARAVRNPDSYVRYVRAQPVITLHIGPATLEPPPPQPDAGAQPPRTAPDAGARPRRRAP